uniref:GOLD domain-containing protein n=1 Tax=Chromera velia CCMP2878 TaxID=1169474 RepID=A0A0G4FSA1_9ALVE|eukprot:Cvel_18413.t1-p1 / transcript=Cvel_18413.t1 / gene=Cvel_18413 / organism=Chromera_velia_CCMP2878 / gene_product=Transmembrane emp24 domain-containing protein 2, putative / transcript_product=Transmembrane emp24 domain-containing protein 2, putative / location=Cvel_scaffold1523:20132-20839(-) / protein_length=236 / sequence_SO=supercontig / SO=protein_coding / is_pseudo=false
MEEMEKQMDREMAMGVETPEELNATYSDIFEDEKDFGGGGSSLIEEWEIYMQNFVPEMLVTFPLAARSDEYFYEDVGEAPVHMRGGYFVSTDEDESDVDFQITDPAGDVIFKKTNAEGLFHFETKMSGSYSFIVSNHKWMQTKMVTFAVGRGNDTALAPAHLSTMDEHMSKIEMSLKDIQSESTYMWIRQRSHMKAVESTNGKVFWFSLLELLVLCVISAFQIYFIKGLLSDRRIL